MLSGAVDPFLSCLLILLGAMFAYALDELFLITGTLENWLNDWMNQD